MGVQTQILTPSPTLNFLGPVGVGVGGGYHYIKNPKRHRPSYVFLPTTCGWMMLILLHSGRFLLILGGLLFITDTLTQATRASEASFRAYQSCLSRRVEISGMARLYFRHVGTTVHTAIIMRYSENQSESISARGAHGARTATVRRFFPGGACLGSKRCFSATCKCPVSVTGSDGQYSDALLGPLVPLLRLLLLLLLPLLLPLPLPLLLLLLPDKLLLELADASAAAADEGTVVTGATKAVSFRTLISGCQRLRTAVRSAVDNINTGVSHCGCTLCMCAAMTHVHIATRCNRALHNYIRVGVALRPLGCTGHAQFPITKGAGGVHMGSHNRCCASAQNT